MSMILFSQIYGISIEGDKFRKEELVHLEHRKKWNETDSEQDQNNTKKKYLNSIYELFQYKLNYIILQFNLFERM